jgi:hypothetical protein
VSSRAATVFRWVWAAVWAVVLVLALTTGSVVTAVVAACLCLLWVWLAIRSARPRPPVPAHVDEQWARGVLAAAGGPDGVAAVKALRDAEPVLSLLDAKELADRAQA